MGGRGRRQRPGARVPVGAVLACPQARPHRRALQGVGVRRLVDGRHGGARLGGRARGLGVSTGAQAREIGAYADGVIVGSALVRTLFSEPFERALVELGALADELVGGVKGARR